MAAPDPLPTAQDVANEPGVDLSASEIPVRWLERAARAVNRRLPNETDEWLLEELQILVTAHYAYPKMTGDVSGDRVSSVTQGDSKISYETGDAGESSDAPGGHHSPFWEQAVALDERMDRDEPFEFDTL